MEPTEYKAVAEAVVQVFFSEFKKFLLEMHAIQEEKLKEATSVIDKLKDLLK